MRLHFLEAPIFKRLMHILTYSDAFILVLMEH